MKLFRLIRSSPASASRNMELDNRIFSRYLEDGIPVFRVYRWQSPSFTYGFSQSPEKAINMERCLSEGIEIAGRITGGGILFHHDEITYSIACGKKEAGEPEGVFVSYRQICAFLLRFYKTIGIPAAFAIDAGKSGGRRVPSELCSASHEKYDIVTGGRKIGGNAQRRKRSAIFQHGSIPCSIDWDFVRRFVPGLPENIASTTTFLSRELNNLPGKNTLEEILIDSFANEFQARFIEENESEYETSMAA